MIRAVAALLQRDRWQRCRDDRGRARCPRSLSAARLIVCLFMFSSAGCAVVPRSRMDECQRLAQTLRAENARIKDRLLAAQSQNRDYAERAVDDAKRLAVQDQALERLNLNIQAYQDERTRLEAAYRQLATSLGASETLGDTLPHDLGQEPEPGKLRNASATAPRAAAANRKDDQKVNK